MKLEICNNQMKCDFYGCKNVAKYKLKTKGFFRKEIVFCEYCMKKMYENFSKVFIPKPVDAPFKNGRRSKML